MQEKLRKEINRAAGESKQVSYEDLMDLQYLDQVIYESLRMNSPLTFSNRECSESIELEGANGKKVVIEEGLRVFIPIVSIQHDPGLSQN